MIQLMYCYYNGENMPVYDYKCNTCSSAIEFKREFGEDREPVCCNNIMQRQWSAPGVMFNAPGFYSSDNRK
jgi:putative FmdB family regulatory protein